MHSQPPDDCGPGLRQLAPAMPRNDGTHLSTPRRHHRPMHSGRKGSGHDRKIRKAKQSYGDRRPLCHICGRPTQDPSRHKRNHHRT